MNRLLIFLSAVVMMSPSLDAQQKSTAVKPNRCAIASINQNKCWWGWLVDIGLSNFPTTFTSCVVKVNGAVCQNQPFTEAERIDNIQHITFTIPMGAGTGTVTVELDGTIIVGPTLNYIKTSKPTIKPFVKIAGKDPTGLCTDLDGNIYIADRSVNKILKIASNSITSATYAGTGDRMSVDGKRDTAKFDTPTAICLDSKGNLYVTERTKIRKINPDGIVSTIAGSNKRGYADGAGASANFMNLTAICADGLDNIYVADSSRIRLVNSNGNVITLAGSTVTGKVDGQGYYAQFGPKLFGICSDRNNNLYVTDYLNHRICKITASGLATTIIGIKDTIDVEYSLDDQNYYFIYPRAIYSDDQNNLFAILGDGTTKFPGKLIIIKPDFKVRTMGHGPVLQGNLYNPVGLIPNRRSNLQGNFMTLEAGINSTSHIVSIPFE